jgi:hypothetical protein
VVEPRTRRPLRRSAKGTGVVASSRRPKGSQTGRRGEPAPAMRRSPQHQAREDENDPRGLCTHAEEGSSEKPQFKARLAAFCKSVAKAAEVVILYRLPGHALRRLLQLDAARATPPVELAAITEAPARRTACRAQ